MKKMWSVFLLLVLFVSVVAAESTVVNLKLDAGEKVIVRLKNIDTGEVIETPELQTDVEGSRFLEFDVVYAEVNFLVYTTQDWQGDVKDEVLGPFQTGGIIELDLRENKPVAIVETAPEINESANVSVGEVENNSVEYVVEENSSDVWTGAKKIVLSGKAIFTKEDGSVNWIYSSGGFLVLVVLIILLFFMFHHKGAEKEVFKDEDEKELEDMEKKVKEKGDEIKHIKEVKGRKEKINEAKVKLDEEEKELSELKGEGNADAVEKQEEVVEHAEDKVESVSK